MSCPQCGDDGHPLRDCPVFLPTTFDRHDRAPRRAPRPRAVPASKNPAKWPPCADCGAPITAKVHMAWKPGAHAFKERKTG